MSRPWAVNRQFVQRFSKATRGIRPSPRSARPLTLAGLTAAYGGQWQIHAAEFCYVAVRRPTPTAQEILTARTPEQLAAKIDAEP